VEEQVGDTADLLGKRTANASRSLWSQTLVSNVCPATTVVGSGQRPKQTARSLSLARHGFIASAVARRNKRRVRGFFLLGFFCGFMAGATLRKRHRGLNALGTVARCADVRRLTAGIRRSIGRFAGRAVTSEASHVRLGSWPPQSHRQMSQRPALGWGRSLGSSCTGPRASRPRAKSEINTRTRSTWCPLCWNRWASRRRPNCTQ
jgi:hypothetical protein